MDKDSFHSEIIKTVKQNNLSQKPVEQLSKQKMAQLDSNVYAHIDQVFSDSADTQAAANANNAKATDRNQQSLLGSIKSQLSDWFSNMGVQPVAFAAITLCAVGAMTFFLTDKQTTGPYFDIPESVAAAELDKYIEVPTAQSRALAPSSPSDRRSAFLAGITQADLDIIGDADNPIAQQLAIQYQEITTNEKAVDATEALNSVHSSAELYTNNEETNSWFKQGYAVEIVHLTALRSMSDMNTDLLQDALEFYRDQDTKPDLQDTGVAKQYIQNHELLLNNKNPLSTPEEVQQIITTTQNMKLLIQ